MTMTTLDDWRVIMENEFHHLQHILDEWDGEQQALGLLANDYKKKNADLLAALKAHYDNRLVTDALSLAGLGDELDAIGQAIADAEGGK